MRATRLLAVTVAAAVMAGLVAASHTPLSLHPPGRAVLRLAWSARPERIEHCRAQSNEELARLPPHMRQPVVCEGVTARYRLTASQGARVVADRVVTAGGLRQDRRLYVLQEIPIEAGDALFQVQFERIDSASAPTAGGGDRRQDAVPALLNFTEHRRVDPHTVLLVTYDSDRRALVAKSPAGSPP